MFVEGLKIIQWIEPPKWNIPISCPLVTEPLPLTKISQLETSAILMSTIISPLDGSSELLRQFVAEIDQYREHASIKEPEIYEKIMHDMVGRVLQEIARLKGWTKSRWPLRTRLWESSNSCAISIGREQKPTSHSLTFFLSGLDMPKN